MKFCRVSAYQQDRRGYNSSLMKWTFCCPSILFYRNTQLQACIATLSLLMLVTHQYHSRESNSPAICERHNLSDCKMEVLKTRAAQNSNLRMGSRHLPAKSKTPRRVKFPSSWAKRVMATPRFLNTSLGSLLLLTSCVFLSSQIKLQLYFSSFYFCCLCAAS